MDISAGLRWKDGWRRRAVKEKKTKRKKGRRRARRANWFRTTRAKEEERGLLKSEPADQALKHAPAARQR